MDTESAHLYADDDQTPAPSAGPDADADAIVGGARGPYLIAGPVVLARSRIDQLAARLGLEPVVVPADTIGLGGDPVADTTAALRDALFLRVRVLKKVYEGRVTALTPLTRDRDFAAARLPPATLEVMLETDEDSRRLRLEGAFVKAFVASGATIGDIVQIDKEHPIVTVRRDRIASEGRVSEERDFVHRVRLGDRDRLPVSDEGDASSPGVALPPLGTGRQPPAGIDAMRATDRWVEAQLGGKGTRLEPGFLLLSDADTLPDRALVVLREALATPYAPLVALHSTEGSTLARWERFFAGAMRLSP